MKKHSLIGKNLVLDSLSIKVCKSKKDFNININKLIEKMNNMDMVIGLNIPMWIY